MEIVIIGSGNVATALGRKMLAAGHRIVQVYSRNPEHAAILAGILQSAPVSSLHALRKNAGLTLIAVSDNAFPALLAALPKLTSFLVHTAGSVSMDMLKDSSARYGVLYPLQSFRKEMQTAAEFPLLIDAGTENDLQLLAEIAAGLSKTVIPANDAMRMKYHLGGVFVNNFSNHLFALAESWCHSEGIDFRLLHPLIQETCSRLEYASAEILQTGPAIRNDTETIKKQLGLLRSYPGLSRVYEMLTRSIADFHADGRGAEDEG
jgi:predicted short-subunit dehydrogenase-like oxidoreductase (DUF2520 family)